MANQEESSGSSSEEDDAGFNEEEVGHHERFDGEALCMGDFVTLELLKGTLYLSAEGVLEDGCVACHKPERFDDCIFQISYKQSYSARRELKEFLEAEAAEEAAKAEAAQIEAAATVASAAAAAAAAAAATNTVSMTESGQLTTDVNQKGTEYGGSLKHKNGEEDEEQEGADEDLLLNKAARMRASRKRNVENEKIDNEKNFAKSIGAPIKFGDEIMLRHVKSNKFVTICQEIARSEPENLRVYLDPQGSPSSWWTIQVHNKLEKEGDELMTASDVLFVLTEGDGTSGLRSSAKWDPNRRYKHDREVNLGECSGWRLRRYSPYYNMASKELHAGELIQIYEPELKAYLTLRGDVGEHGTSLQPKNLYEEQSVYLDAYFEVQGAETLVKSSYIWVVERHGNTRSGGRIAFDSGYLQLRHLNSGRYLCCRSESMWTSSTAKVATVNALKATMAGMATSAARIRGGKKFIFSSMGKPNTSTSLLVRQAHFVETRGAKAAHTQNQQLHGQFESASAKDIVYLDEGAPVQIESYNNYWLHQGKRVGNTEVFSTSALAHQKDNAKVLMQRFATTDEVMADIMVGVSARPILQRYLRVVKKHMDPKELCGEPVFSNFMRAIGQLTNFVSGFSVSGPSKDTDGKNSKNIVKYEEIEQRLRLHGASGIDFRQQLLREQDVLQVVLSIVTELVGDRSTKIASEAARRADKKQYEENRNAPLLAGEKLKKWFELLKQKIAHASCWLLRLSVLENYESQMMVADYLETLIKCIQLQGGASGIATEVVTHMLGTNLDLQENKVQVKDIDRFIFMTRASRLSKAGLDLLRSVCSCKGHGIDNNQGRVVTSLLENAEDLIIKTAPDMGRMPVDGQWKKRITDKDLVQRIRGGNVLKDGLKKVLVTWEVGNNAADLSPYAIVSSGNVNSSMGPGWVPLNTLFDTPSTEQRATVQEYFISQIYLDAEMCLDRNYCAMQILEEHFPYEMCLSILMDSDLPKRLKAAVMTLMCSLYVDGYPQMRILVPQLSRSWDEIDPIQPYFLPRPPEPLEFYLLQDILATSIEQMNQKSLNDEYTLAQMRLLLYLVKFRFYSSSSDVHNLTVPLLNCLDCREEPVDNLNETIKVDQKPCAIFVYDFLESVLWLVIILLLVLIGIILMSIQMFGGGIESCNTGVAAFEYSASIIFMLDLVVKIYCFKIKFSKLGPFFRDRFSQIDILVVLIDVVLYSFDWFILGDECSSTSEDDGDDSGGNAGSLAKSMRAVRLIRLVRVVKAAKIVRVLNEWDDEDEPEWEIPARYVEAPQQQLHTMLQIIRILNEISLLTRDFLLGNMLVEWKRSVTPEFGNRRLITAFPARHSTGVTWYKTRDTSMGIQTPDITDVKLKESAAELFTRLVATADDYSLSTASDSVDLIFLDLVMYNDKDLTQAALNLLMVHHSMQEILFVDLKATQLLVRRDDQKLLSRLREDLIYLQNAAERHELWGDLETPEDQKENAKTKKVLKGLAKACYTRNSKPDFSSAYHPYQPIQIMIRNLGGIDTALTVLKLHPSIEDADDDEVRENTRELLKLCNIWLSWLISDNIENQKAAYEHLDFFFDTLNDGIDSALVISSIIRGNSELIRQVPIGIINRLAEEIIRNGPESRYMMILEAMVFLDDYEGDNNTVVQSTILKELTRSDRAERTMLLCKDIHGAHYSERIKWMEQSNDTLENIRGYSSDESVTLHYDSRYATPKLSYHCRLLEVLSGCAYGRLNVTTVETKLQSILPSNDCLCALLDSRTTIDVKASMAAYVYHVIVDTEIPVAGLGRNLLLWQLFETIPEYLSSADDLLSKPMAFVACGDGPIAILARQHLMCTWFMIRMIATFFSTPDYWQSSMLNLNEDELLHSPSIPDKIGRSYYDRYVQGVDAEVYEGPLLRPTYSFLDTDRTDTPGGAASPNKQSITLPVTEDDELHLDKIAAEIKNDAKIRINQEEAYLDSILSETEPAGAVEIIDDASFEEDDENSLDETSVFSDGTFDSENNDMEENWIAILLETLHEKMLSLFLKHREKLRENEQKVLLDALEVLQSIKRHTNTETSPLPTVIPDEDDFNESIGQHVAQQLKQYTSDLEEDEDLQRQIVNDTTKIITVIENLPSIEQGDIEADLRKEALIKKFVTHVENCIDVDENKKHLSPEATRSTIWTVRLFRRMIEQKWNKSIEERDEDGGEDDDIASEEIMQLLNKHGGTDLCIDLIAVGIDQELVIEAVKLGVALLFKEGGNVDVQITMNKRLRTTDSTLFFREIRTQIHDMRRFYEFGNPICEGDREPLVPDNLIVLRFLQLMSEGHYKPNQDVVRTQPENNVQINLLDDMVKLLNECSLKVSRSSISCAGAVADLILEVIQGPCENNQIHFVMDTPLVDTMNRLLRNQPSDNKAEVPSEEADEEVKTCCIDIFEALLEGQVLNSPIAVRLLGLVDLEVMKVIIEAPNPDGDLSDLQLAALVLLQTFMDFKPSLRKEPRMRLLRRIQNRLGKDVQNIEVNWDGTLIRRFFSVPPICKHIADATKDNLVENVARETQDSKLQDFLLRAQDILLEVKHQENLSDIHLGPWIINGYEIPGTKYLSKFNLAQVFSRRNQENITWCGFFCALTINIIFLFTLEHKAGWVPGMGPTVDYKNGGFYSTYGTHGVGSFDASGNLLDSTGSPVKPDSEIYYGKYDDAWKIVVQSLNVLNIAFSFFTLLLFIIVRCPVKFRKLKETKHWVMALLSTSSDTLTMYYFIYTIIAFISYRYEKGLHPFLLMDIIVKNSTTADVVKAVVYPIKQLAAAALLGVFVIYIFAMITFKNFASDFRYDGGDDAFGKPGADDFMPQEEAEHLNEDCRTLWGCFKVSLNYGMRLSGGTGDIMTHTLEARRLILDLLYFLIVLVVLLNVIFGIIIDTFSELRQMNMEKQNDKSGFCFICGIASQTFEQASSEPGQFKRHIKEEHSMWSYLNFIIFIWEQDKDDDDGLEYYVRKLLEKGDITWFPIGKALRLVGTIKEEESVADRLDRMRQEIKDSMEESRRRRLNAMNEVSTALHSMLHACHRAALEDFMYKTHGRAKLVRVAGGGPTHAGRN